MKIQCSKKVDDNVIYKIVQSLSVRKNFKILDDDTLINLFETPISEVIYTGYPKLYKT